MKKLAKAQYGKVLKVAAKRAADAVTRKKNMALDLKAGAALATGAGSMMYVDKKLQEKRKGPYSPYKSLNKTATDSTKIKKTGGSVKAKKK